MHSYRSDLKLQQIRDVATQLKPMLLNTPTMPLHGAWSERSLASDAPASITLKLELFQHTGSFKVRGALNSVMGLSAEQKARGITAASAGNHAVALAYAARKFGVSAKIAVTASTNPIRLALARSYGAEIIVCSDAYAAFETAQRLVQEEERVMIHPFDSEAISLATGGIGLEIVDQVPEVEAVVIAVGGGGLISGAAAALKQLRPNCQVWGVEPEGANAMQQSLLSGLPTRLASINTIADSLGAPMTLPYSLGLCQSYIDGIVSISDEALCSALAMLFFDSKLAVEPAGAAALAAVIGPLRQQLRGLHVVLVVCGANIDSNGFTRYLARGEQTLIAEQKN
ncbi:threonine ammonia-lyase [Undibacterium curvum]|uniref:threonine ammonia-lyase n=1 Tax=Undibacterium curvum TaxID=2762294 RepID=UPI003D0BFA7B